MNYSYAKLSDIDLGLIRMRGRGLGNLLFPWAEFVMGTARYNLIPLAPTWPQLLFGPFIRNEADKRLYSDLFITTPEQVSGIRKLMLLSTLPRISESQFVNGSSCTNKKAGSLLVQFCYSDDYFKNILLDHAIIRNEILRMTKEHHMKGLAHNFSKSISVHVRLGDFRVESLQTPLTWFRGAINQVRKLTGVEAPVFIFSDGEDEELASLLTLPGVRRLTFGSSIADLLALSASNVLIANGGSTFSKWASFLGRMPVLWPPRTLYQKLYFENAEAEVEWGIGESLPQAFAAQVSSRL